MTIVLILLAIILTSVLISFCLNYSIATQTFTRIQIKPHWGFLGLLIIALILGFVLSSLFVITNNWYFETVVSERADLGHDLQNNATFTPSATASVPPTPTP